MIVRSIQVGTPITMQYEGREIRTAFLKQLVQGPVYLGTLGLVGDQQVHALHGGSDRAALLYAAEHYPYWAEFLGRTPGPALLGENLTISGLTEETACIGDTYRIGAALVQVSQPRVPCAKINVAHETRAMLSRVIATGYTGFFVRVLEEGHVAAGDQLERVDRPTGAPTVAELNRVLYHEKGDRDAVRRMLQATGLAEQLRGMLQERLAEA